ncbi:MAG: hypothetical protein WC783_04215 [Candidatus Paceibacterota bacterium]|jgi:hypothetical protein
METKLMKIFEILKTFLNDDDLKKLDQMSKELESLNKEDAAEVSYRISGVSIFAQYTQIDSYTIFDFALDMIEKKKRGENIWEIHPFDIYLFLEESVHYSTNDAKMGKIGPEFLGITILIKIYFIKENYPKDYQVIKDYKKDLITEISKIDCENIFKAGIEGAKMIIAQELKTQLSEFELSKKLFDKSAIYTEGPGTVN